jgi:tryptophan-rich sensory protein
MYKALIVLVVAIVGSIITYYGLKSPLYDDFLLPVQQPPKWVFGLVWTFIYITYAYVWTSYIDTSYGNALFMANMVLNLLWVYVFFGSFSLGMSRVIIVMLLVLTLYQAYYLWSSEKNGVSVFLMLIYAAWLITATGINFSITEKVSCSCSDMC